MKKKTKEQVLKEEIVTLKDKLNEVSSNNKWHKGILEDIAEFLNLTLYSDSSTSVNTLKKKVAEAIFFQKQYEGSYRPQQEVIENQREIIRWLIKPSTAEKPPQEIINEYRRKGLL